MRLKANDLFQTLPGRDTTPEGFVVVAGAMARTGIQQYYAYEMGLKDRDPLAIVSLYRPADEVFNTDSLRSFENKPITIEHPPVHVDAANWATYAKGEVRDVRAAGDLMMGTLVLKSKDAVDTMNSGKVQLSNGYSYELDMTPGVTPDGKAYDGVQRNIRGNHVALVDSARCGPVCRVSDSKTLNTGDLPMAETRKVIVDGIPLDVSETAAAAIDKLTASRNEATKRAEDAEKRLGGIVVLGVTHTVDSLVALVTEQDAKIKDLSKDVMTPEARDAMVAEWTGMLADSAKLAPELKVAGKTCLAVRKEVISAVAAKDAVSSGVVKAILGDIQLADANPDQVKAIFNVLVATAKQREADVTGQDATVAAHLTSATGTGKEGVQLSGRDAMLARQAEAWNKK